MVGLVTGGPWDFIDNQSQILCIMSNLISINGQLSQHYHQTTENILPIFYHYQYFDKKLSINKWKIIPLDQEYTICNLMKLIFIYKYWNWTLTSVQEWEIIWSFSDIWEIQLKSLEILKIGYVGKIVCIKEVKNIHKF